MIAPGHIAFLAGYPSRAAATPTADSLDYLLSGLVTCETCGCSCAGRITAVRGKKYSYHRCNQEQARCPHRAPLGHAPYVNALWLEDKVWADVRRFLESPGEVLERAREQTESDDTSAALETRYADLTHRFDTNHKERDRWLRLYAQGHISDAELETHLADLRAQLENLKLF